MLQILSSSALSIDRDTAVSIFDGERKTYRSPGATRHDNANTRDFGIRDGPAIICDDFQIRGDVGGEVFADAINLSRRRSMNLIQHVTDKLRKGIHFLLCEIMHNCYFTSTILALQAQSPPSVSPLKAIFETR